MVGGKKQRSIIAGKLNLPFGLSRGVSKKM
jgi:hypothetical protein